MNRILNSHHPKKHIKSFYYALKGLRHVFINEANFRIHILATVVVSILAYYLNFNYFEWIVLSFTVGFVLMMEIINSLIEEMVDHLVQEHSESAGIVKDLSAAAVLLAAVLSLFVAALLFLPKLLLLFV